MSKQYDFGAFDNEPTAAEVKQYDFSAFDNEPAMDAQAQPMPAPESEDGVLRTAADFGLGAAQGASLGFADEAQGAIEALADVASDKYELKDLYQRYLSQRDEARQMYDEASVRSPNANLAGNLAGGVATAFVPGVNAMGAVKAGALLGGAAGLGMSQADLAQGDVQGAIVDTALGTAGGAVMGKLVPAAIKTGGKTAAATGLAGAGLGAAYGAIDDDTSVLNGALTGGMLGYGAGALAKGVANKAIPMIDDLAPKAMNIFKAEAAGERTVGKQAREGAVKEYVDHAKGMIDTTFQEAKSAGEVLETLARDASDEGQKIDTRKPLEAAAKRLKEIMDASSEGSTTRKEAQEALQMVEFQLKGPEVDTLVPITGAPKSSGLDKALSKAEQARAKEVLKYEQAPGSAEKALLKRLEEAQAKAKLTNTPTTDPVMDMGDGMVTGQMGLGDDVMTIAKKIESMKVGPLELRNIDGNDFIVVPTAKGSEKLVPVPADKAEVLTRLKVVKQRIGDNSEKSPMDLFKFRKGELSDKLDIENGMTSGDVRGALSDLKKGVNQGLDNVEGFTDQTQKVASLKKALDDFGVKTTDRFEADGFDAAMKKFANLDGETLAGEMNDRVLKQAVDSIGKANPKLAEELGARHAQKVNRLELTGKQGKIDMAAGLTGRAVNYTKKQLLAADKNMLGGLAQKFIATGDAASQRLANVLQKASEGTEMSRKALMFTVIQNPQYRDMLGISEDDAK